MHAGDVGTWAAFHVATYRFPLAAGRVLAVCSGDPARALAASNATLARVPGVTPALRAALRQADRRVGDREVAWCREHGVRLCPRSAPEYPRMLQSIPDPPTLLYVRGALTPADETAVALVGSRRASPYGRRQAERLARDLAGVGVTVVSGLARGCDAAAHRGALAAGGRTIAVLGCGIDVAYPPEHAALGEAIAAQGAVVTEFPPGTRPLPEQFPVRNRIIAGLAQGVLVVEAAARSGSLITARLALDQGREVWAVPGRVTDPACGGTLRLLKEGAGLVRDAADVLAELRPDLLAALARRIGGDRPAAAPEGPPDDPAARKVLAALAPDEPVHRDTLQARTALDASRLAAALLALELAGRVRQLPGNRFVVG